MSKKNSDTPVEETVPQQDTAPNAADTSAPEAETPEAVCFLYGPELLP